MNHEEDRMYSHLTAAVAAERTYDDAVRAAEHDRRREATAARPDRRTRRVRWPLSDHRTDPRPAPAHREARA